MKLFATLPLLAATALASSSSFEISASPSSTAASSSSTSLTAIPLAAQTNAIKNLKMAADVPPAKTCQELGMQDGGLVYSAPCYQICKHPSQQKPDRIILRPEGSDCGYFLFFPQKCTANGICKVA